LKLQQIGENRINKRKNKMKQQQHIPQQCIIRLQKEYLQIQKEKIPNIECAPLESNLLEWHYVIHDLNQQQSTSFCGGIYHGKLVFSPQYPYKPPSIYMLTPNGRFQINQRICTSMSDFHPETWRPLWSIRSILIGLLSFFLDEKEPQTYGSVQCSQEEKRKYARHSMQHNLKNDIFCDLFPQFVKQYKLEQKQQRIQQQQQQMEQQQQQRRQNQLIAPLTSPSSAATPYINTLVFILVALFILYLAL
jgi:ubiquitin-conjugating enzyme E2 J2